MSKFNYDFDYIFYYDHSYCLVKLYQFKKFFNCWVFEFENTNLKILEIKI